MASGLPSTIRAFIQPEASNTTTVVQTAMPIPSPAPDSDEHLIKVYATAPCSGELTWAKNFPYLLEKGKELVPCYDLSGVVVQAPKDSPFQAGTEIYTRTDAQRTGNARDYTIAVTSELSRKPKTLNWTDAASVPLSAFTAYQALIDHGGLADLKDADCKEKNRDKTVLITAAAGGVGVWLVQLAREAGVGSIIAVCSTDKVDSVRALGATEVIDYRKSDVKSWAQADQGWKADLVIDCVGGKSLQSCWYAVKRGGMLLCISGVPEDNKPEDCKVENVKSKFFIMEPYGYQLDVVRELIDSGKCKPIVDSIYEFEQTQEAFDRQGSGKAKGKVMIKVAA